MRIPDTVTSDTGQWDTEIQVQCQKAWWYLDLFTEIICQNGAIDSKQNWFPVQCYAIGSWTIF